MEILGIILLVIFVGAIFGANNIFESIRLGVLVLIIIGTFLFFAGKVTSKAEVAEQRAK